MVRNKSGEQPEAAALTTAVAVELAPAEPAPFVAVTVTATVEPTSVGVSV